MKRKLTTLALGVVGTLLFIEAAVGAPASVQATTTATTAAGVWQQVDDDGNVGALVTITEENGVYVGQLSRLYLGPADDPNPICTECPGDKHNQPLLGFVFIEEMKQSGLDYDGGTILHPATGNTYRASMHLSPDGTKLTVRGYLGPSAGARPGTGFNEPVCHEKSSIQGAAQDLLNLCRWIAIRLVSGIGASLGMYPCRTRIMPS